MAKWIITGASGSLATACIKILIKNKINVNAFSRNNLKIDSEYITFSKVDNYKHINLDLSDCECVLLAQGHFNYELFEKMTLEEIDEIIEANLISQINVLHKLLSQVNKNKRIEIVIFGSTNAYEAGTGTVAYGAAKAGILGLVKALNKEYIDTDIRFWLISFGTLANEMGSKVPNQEFDSLLDVDKVAKEIFNIVNNKTNLWQPEIVIRRRHIRTKN
jgi:short-subunit dehydrogenase